MRRSTRSMAIPRTVVTPRSTEIKEFIFGNSSVIGANSFVLVTPSSLITQGTTFSQRIGNRIRIKSIEIAGTFGAQAAGAAPITATFFNAHSATAYTLVDYQGPFIYDETGSAYPGQIAINQLGDNDNTYMLEKYWAGAGVIQRYDKDSGNVVSNTPQLMLQNPSAVNSSGQIVWIKIRFYDY